MNYKQKKAYDHTVISLLVIVTADSCRDFRD